MTQPVALDYEDFSGGMADPNSPNDRKTAYICQNFDITIEKKLRERAGSHILDDTASLIATSAGGVRENGRTGSLLNYEEDLHLIIRSLGGLYAKNAASWDPTTVWTKLSSLNSGFEALPSHRALTAAAVVSKVLYKGQLLLVGKDESYSTPEWVVPTKVYLDHTNTFRSRRASMPAPNDPLSLVGYARLLATSMTVANDLKATLNTHFSDTSAHGAYTTTITTADATDESTLCTLIPAMVSAYNSHVQVDAQAAHRQDTTGGSTYKIWGNFPVPNIPTPVSVFDCYKILNKLVFAFNTHNIGFLYTDGANDIIGFAQGQTATFNTGAGTCTFSYSGTQVSWKGMRLGDQLHFGAGTLPTGLVTETTYFAVPTGTGIKLASTLAHAISGVTIALSGSPSNVLVYQHPQNLHPKLTTQSGVDYDPNITGNSFASTAVQGIQAPAIITDTYTNYVTHTSGTNYHNNNALWGYTASISALINDTSYGASGGFNARSAAKVFASIYKLHFAFLWHRVESSGEYHGSGSTENTGTILLNTTGAYTFNSIPDYTDASFWNFNESILKDFNDHLFSTNANDTPSITGHVTYGSTRHSGAWNSGDATYRFKRTYSNIQYAFVATAKYTTYENKIFEDISAPLVSDSILYSTRSSFGTPGIDEPFEVLILDDFQFIDGYGRAPVVDAIEGVDATNISIEIYRTIRDGTVFYLANTYNNISKFGPHYYLTDNSSDMDIQSLGDTIYTTGGVVANDELPRATTVACVADTIYLGNIIEESVPDVFNPTFTYGNPGIVNITAHGISNGEQVTFYIKSTASNVPGGIGFGGLPYFAVNVSANSLQLATSPGGPAIGLTDPGSVSCYMFRQKFTKYPKRVRQSNITSTFSSTANFFAETESEVVCIGSAQQYGVVVCKQGVFRVENKFTDDGQGSMVLERISDRVGGVSANGGITVNSNYYFMGLDGFYMTDGFTVSPLSPHLKQTHKAIVDQNTAGYSSRNSGVQCEYDKIENRIVWAVNRGNSDYNTETWVLHLNHSMVGRGAFTDHNGSTQYYPTAIAYFRAQLIRGDKQGFVFAHSDTYYNDPKINRASTGSLVSGVGVAIPYQYRSLAEDFGNKSLRKIVSKILLQMENNGNLTMAIQSINDKNPTYAAPLKDIRYRGEYTGLIKERRTFPVPGSLGVNLQGTRCYLKQVDFTPATDTLYKSDDYAVATLASGTLTLASGNWPTPNGGIEDFLIYFETDNYVAGHVVSSVSTNTLTVATAPSDFSGKKWILKGIPKDERAQFQALSLYHQQIDAQPMPPTGATTGNT